MFVAHSLFHEYVPGKRRGRAEERNIYNWNAFSSRTV